jgi:hypothetical protein
VCLLSTPLSELNRINASLRIFRVTNLMPVDQGANPNSIRATTVSSHLLSELLPVTLCAPSGETEMNKGHKTAPSINHITPHRVSGQASIYQRLKPDQHIFAVSSCVVLNGCPDRFGDVLTFPPQDLKAPVVPRSDGLRPLW